MRWHAQRLASARQAARRAPHRAAKRAIARRENREAVPWRTLFVVGGDLPYSTDRSREAADVLQDEKTPAGSESAGVKSLERTQGKPRDACRVALSRVRAAAHHERKQRHGKTTISSTTLSSCCCWPRVAWSA